MFTLIYLLISTASALPDKILLPTGPGYIGILLPEEKGVTKRLDAVLIEPRTGELWVEHSDDTFQTRVYRGNHWELSERAEYEYKGEELISATDIWNVSIQYQYKKEMLVGITWPSGRKIQIDYDERNRVKKMVDSTGQILSVKWWNKERATLTDRLGYSLQWTLTPDSIWVKDSKGTSVRTLYKEGELVGWEDPRGQRTQIVQNKNQIHVKDGFSRTWTIEEEDDLISSISISGIGSWSWRRNQAGKIIEIVDPSSKRLEVEQNSQQKSRIHRSGSPVSFLYNSSDQLKEISDAYGYFLRVKRDPFGQMLLLEDALGGKIFFQRGEGGILEQMTLRNGQKWNFEYDVMKRLRNLHSPNQDLISFSRDGAGRIIAVDYAHQKKIRFNRDSRGYIRTIELSDGTKRELPHDVLGQINSDSGSGIRLSRDALGNITSVTQNQRNWRVSRDAYGQISRWNETSFSRNAAGFIVSIQEPSIKWNIPRDSMGRILSIEKEDKLISVEYDALGYPRVWIEGQKKNLVKRNQYSWITEDADLKIKRDRRGWIKEIEYGDNSWSWRRDGAGFTLQAFSGKDLRLGFERDDSGQLVALKFPNGAYQRWILRGDQLFEKLVGIDGIVLEQNDYVLSDAGWGSEAEKVFQDPEMLASLYEYDAIGLRLRESQDNLEIFDYDSFGRLTQVCGVDGCHHFFYDALGRLAGYQDEYGLPVSLLWGYSGIENERGAFDAAPLLHGGERWLNTPFGTGLIRGYNAEPRGFVFSVSGSTNWRIEGSEVVSGVQPEEEADAVSFQQGQLVYENLGLSFSDGLVWDHQERKYLQSEQFWQSKGMEADLFQWLSEPSIWNDPLRILFAIGYLEEEKGWSSIAQDSVFPWLNPVIQEGQNLGMPGVDDFPFREDGLEQFLIENLLQGHTDPSNSAIIQFVIAQEMDEIPIFFQKDINKCTASLAFFFQC